MIQKLVKVIDSILSQEITCSIGDIMHKGKELDEGQLTVLTRYYDIIQYIEKDNHSFILQNTLSRIIWGNEHDESAGNKSFSEIIESYKFRGYNGSRIVIDKAISLVNGSHRVALNLYFDYWQICAKRIWRSIYGKRNLNWYINKGLQQNVVDEIGKIWKQMNLKLFDSGVAFVFILDNISLETVVILKELINQETKEHRIYRLSMPKQGIMVLFSLVNPDYIIKQRSLYSRRADKLYEIITNRIQFPLKERAFNCSEGKKIFDKYNLYIEMK